MMYSEWFKLQRSALDELKAWCLTGDRPLPEQMLTNMSEASVA